MEFLEVESADRAKALNGAMLADRAIKVNDTKNPIVKPAAVGPVWSGLMASSRGDDTHRADLL